MSKANMIKLFKKIGEKINKFLKDKSRLPAEEKIDEVPIVKSYECSIKVVSPSLKRMDKRIIENKRLFNILRHTKKNRIKKKLAKRIKQNNKLNDTDK